MNTKYMSTPEVIGSVHLVNNDGDHCDAGEKIVGIQVQTKDVNRGWFVQLDELDVRAIDSNSSLRQISVNSMGTDYDPVECLRQEVKRFKETNTFTPMQVTGFYIQAAVVLDILDRLRIEHERVIGSKTLKLAAEVARARQAEIVSLENETYELRDLLRPVLDELLPTLSSGHGKECGCRPCKIKRDLERVMSQ